MSQPQAATTYQALTEAWTDPDIHSIEAHTSGSTGAPRVIFLPKEMVRASAWRTIGFFGITSEWLLTTCISAKYIGGKMMAIRALEANARLEIVDPSNRPDISRALSWKSGVLIAVVPSQMWHLLKINYSPSQLENLRFLIGGSSIPTNLRQEIVRKGIKAWESYGMTETSSHIALRRVSATDTPFIPLEGIRLSQSEYGTLEITLPGAERLTTNDLVEIEADGTFRILGRADNVIITGGLKVIPEQVEARLRSLFDNPDVKEIMVTSRPDPLWGDAILLMVESGASPEVVREYLWRRLREDRLSETPLLASHEIPKEIEITEALPRTENGKLKRK